LLIREKQMQAFSQSCLDKFACRLANHLRCNYASNLDDLGINNEEVVPFVKNGIKNAQQYGIEYDDDLELYVECMVLLCPTFDQDSRFPWAREILKRKDIDGETKMAEIGEYMTFGLEDPK
jgi:hypothetical protein